MDDLDKIVNEAYELFSGNKPGEHLDACTFCCMTEKDAEQLKLISVSQIPFELLKEYQDAAKPEKLDRSELKYFAPRYLELIKDYKYPSFEPLLSLSRFGYLEESDWTQEERKLLGDFAVQFFRKYINSTNHEAFTTPVEILLMFYKGKFNIEGLLAAWENTSSIESLLHFNRLLEGIKMNKHGEPKVWDAFSDDLFNNIICNWIFSEKIKQKFKEEIENAIIEPNELLSESDKESLSLSYELIK